jgi:hypothetical protein
MQLGLILCEGGTEERYFNDMSEHMLARDKLSDVLLEIYRPKNHSPLGLLNEAKKRFKRAAEEEWAYDFAWLVFDKDDHPGIASTFTEARAWKGQPEIRIAFSASCFELYLLLHFEKTTRPFRNCSQTLRELRKHLPDYEKSDGLYAQLYRRKYQAFAHCEFLMKHVATDLERGLMPWQLPTYTNLHELEYFLEGLG